MLSEAEADRRHDRALEEHDRAWNQMHRVGLEEGRDSPTYRIMHAQTVAAAREVREASRRVQDVRRRNRRQIPHERRVEMGRMGAAARWNSTR